MPACLSGAIRQELQHRAEVVAKEYYQTFRNSQYKMSMRSVPKLTLKLEMCVPHRLWARPQKYSSAVKGTTPEQSGLHVEQLLVEPSWSWSLST